MSEPDREGVIEFLFALGVPAVMAMGAAALSDWRWPEAPMRRLAILSALVCPVLLILISVAGFFYVISEDCPPGEVCDSGGIVAAGILLFGGIEIVISLIVGPVIAYATLDFLRRP